MCVENMPCWSRQHGAHEVLAAPAYRPSTSLRWYACNTLQPHFLEEEKGEPKPVHRTAQLMSARSCEIAVRQRRVPIEQSSDDRWCQETVCGYDHEKSDRLSSSAVPLDRL